MASAARVTKNANQNLTPSLKELPRRNFRLGYIGIQHVQWLIRTWPLKLHGNSKAVDKCERPKCAACEFGNGHCQSNKVNEINQNTMKDQELKKDHLLPGNMVSADHYISRAPGRFYQKIGKSDLSDMF